MSVTLNAIQHVGLIVGDMPTMKAFYTQLLGAEPAIETELALPKMSGQLQADHPAIRIALYKLAGWAIELVQYVNPKGAEAPQRTNDIGGKHICFKVDDIEEVYASLSEAGVPFHDAPVHFGEEGGPLCGFAFAYFRDPEGNILEVMQEPSKATQIANKVSEALDRLG